MWDAGRAGRAYDPSVDRVLHRTHTVMVGRFRVTPDHPRFRDSGPIRHAAFVFPRTSVVIRHEGRAPIRVDPCTVTFYNRGQRYEREPLDPAGDRCEWFAIRPDVLRDAVARYDPPARDRPDGPFGRAWGRSDAPTYAAQRAITRYLGSKPEPEPMALEEAVLEVLNRVLARTYVGSSAGPLAAASRDASPDSASQRLVAAARDQLRQRFREDLSLDDISSAVGSSVFHLCRAFKTVTGTTIHRYRQQLRLRQALEMVAERGSNLTAVALELGFSSHSHFSAAFRGAFGVTPSGFRRRPSTRRIRELADRLAASG